MNREYDIEPEDGFEDVDNNFIDDPDKLSNNALAFIALSNEYCATLQNVAQTDMHTFVNDMLRLLPRLYITASDLKVNMLTGEGGYIPPALEEDSYDRIRVDISRIMGEEDTFLEVFVEDMKYSDTPVSATVSESLSDLFQVFYDFLEGCKDAPNYVINELLTAVKEAFADYWSQTLVNVLRALNTIKYNA